MSYFTGIFRVKRYICFDFKFAQKALTVRSSTVNSISTIFLFISLFLHSYCICMHNINLMPLLNELMQTVIWEKDVYGAA